MISAFRVGLAASERGLCDIDRVYFRATQSRVKKLEDLTGENKAIMWDFDFKAVCFCPAKTSQFFDTRFTYSELYSIDITLKS